MSYNDCEQKCKNNGVPGWRGRLGIIPTLDLLNRIKPNLCSFDLKKDIYAGFRTMVLGSNNIGDWFWYENDTAVAPLTLYTGGWQFYGSGPGKDCGFINIQYEDFNKEPCGQSSPANVPFVLCEFVYSDPEPVVNPSFCDNSTGGYHDDILDHCFKIFYCGTTNTKCAEKCKATAGMVDGWRGRLALIPTEDLLNRLMGYLPSFDADHSLFVGFRTMILDSTNINDWFWYENDTAVAPLTVYTGWSVDLLDSNQNCGHVNPGQKKIKDYGCNSGSRPLVLCEFICKDV